MNAFTKNLIVALLSLLFASHVFAKKPIVVAVIDSGIDLSHKQFMNRLYINPGESGKDFLGRDKATNNIDDDGNGFVDDINGWDFVDDDKYAVDTEGHGTHISGIILGVEGSESESSTAIRIMPLKYYRRGESGQLNLIRSVAALKYAIDQRVDIINYSGGGTHPDFFERKLLKEAERLGILVVSAAGNFGKNLSLQHFYPASYKFKNVISVGGLKEDGRLMPESNYGAPVDILAQGEKVFSTLPMKRFGPMSGTSQATALVTNKLAKLLASRPELKSNRQTLLSQIGPYEIKDLGIKVKMPRATSMIPTVVFTDRVAQIFPEPNN